MVDSSPLGRCHRGSPGRVGKADASALASLLSTVDGLDTPLEVDTKIANALLGLATEAFVAAQLASRDASITALQGAKADARGAPRCRLRTTLLPRTSSQVVKPV